MSARDGTSRKRRGRLLLWAKQFDGAANDIFALEDEISAFTALKLQKNPGATTLRRLNERGTKSPAAYQAYQKARFHFHQGSYDDYPKAEDFYKEAVRLDAGYEQAYAGLADNYIAQVIFSMRHPQEVFPLAREAVNKAVALEPDSAETLAALANFNLCFDWNLTAAEQSARGAIELNPNSANAYNLLGQALMFRGLYDESEIAVRRALELDPSGFWHSCVLTICYFLAQRYEQSIQQTHFLTERNPKLFAELIKRSWSLTQLGRYDEALALYEEISTQPGGQAVPFFIGHTYAVAGEREKARATLAELNKISAQTYVSPFFPALVYAGLNETEKAIDCLEQAAANRDPWTIWIATDPRLDNLRSNPRFQVLLNSVLPGHVVTRRLPENVSSLSNAKNVNGHRQNGAKPSSVGFAAQSISPPKIKRKNHRRAASAVAVLLALVGIALAFYKFANRAANDFKSQKIERPIDNQQGSIDAIPPSQTKPYLQMSETEQLAFIREKTRQIENLIEAAPTDYNDDEIRAIKTEIDDYVEEIDSLSQKPFEEGLRVIYGRASQYSPIVARSFAARKVPPALGIYQAMVESEYHDCPNLYAHSKAPVGLFQFRRETAAKYGLMPKDYCSIKKQSNAAAAYMSDLISDFDEKTLALLAFSVGENGVRDYLRQLRERNINKKNAWAIRRNGGDLKPQLNEEHEGFYYVPKFFAAAIIGENPQTFDLSTPPLSTLR